MKPLILCLLSSFLGLSFMALGQQLSGPTAVQKQTDGFDEPPSVMSPPAPGHYRYLYRSAYWNPTTNQWRADSLRVQGRQTWVQTPPGLRMQFEHLAAYNYQTGDTSYSRYTNWGQTPYGYSDTLNRIYRVIGSNPTLREYHRENTKVFPGGYLYAQLEYVNGLDSSFLYYHYYDAQNRLIRSVVWDFGGLPVRRDSIPIIDSSFYQGTSPYPYRERQYNEMRYQQPGLPRRLSISQQTDSIQYDAQGRRIYSASDSWAYIGVPSGHTNIRAIYHQDGNYETITKIYGVSGTPPVPRPLVARWDVNMYTADSAKHYYYNWDNATSAFRLDYRRTTFYPSRGREFLETGEVVNTTDSLKNGVWKPYLGSDNRFLYGTSGDLDRVLIRNTRGVNTIVSMERRAIEFYTDGLLDIKPKRPLATIAVVPNPVKNILTLMSRSPIFNITLINTLGQVYNPPVQDQKVDLSALPQGVYQLIAYDKDTLAGTTRVIKE